MKPFCGLAYVELLQFKEIRNRLILSRKIIIMVVVFVVFVIIVA